MFFSVDPPKKIIVDAFLYKKLCAIRAINFDPRFKIKMYPIVTPDDGNCLLHACTIFISGQEDVDFRLR